MADIKEGLVNILIATDVASRGIDIEDITYVVNYDFPRNIEEYVHVSYLTILSTASQWGAFELYLFFI